MSRSSGDPIYIAAEAGGSIENRVEAAKREFDFPADMPFAAITSPINLCSNDADLERLVSAIRVAEADFGMPVGLIVIDTLSRVLAGGNENGPDGMSAVVYNCDRLREKTGVYLALVHHSGKDASRGSRGHSLLPAAIDTEIEVTRDEDQKSRQPASASSAIFRLRVASASRCGRSSLASTRTAIPSHPASQ